MNELCYICGKKATNREHVPPKCFFPEAKDVPNGHDYRKGLITVPSCEAHNLKKSHDDEYLFYVVLSNYDNNHIAFNQFMTKALRAYNRNPALLNIYSSNCPASIDGIQTKAFKVDMCRLNNAFSFITKGIYYHHYTEICNKIVTVHIPQFFSTNPTANDTLSAIRELASALFQNNVSFYGDNPDVFQYQRHKDDKKNIDVIRMLFYGGFEVISMIK